MGDASLNALVERMHRAGERLLAALSEEERLASVVCQAGDDEAAYGSWAKARQMVEDCRIAYCQAVADCNPPSADQIRLALEAD